MERFNPHKSDSSDEIERRIQLEQLALGLQETNGIPFKRIPEGIYSGMHYITIGDLVSSGKVEYTERHLRLLIRRDVIPAYRFADNTFLDASGVQKILQRQQESLRGNLYCGGRKPGYKNKYG